ncbi:PREDICTED: uncharacterized protein LOC108559595 [Nicrophorus vespilloides]|uniref:Uncharacterized protein LOC108559595 n=1 Tax=Nicrophorus vespilloides TaxID=110193 RepID=A0ABM1MCW6_NICVS|nr:PREDICTED: uncharacterized protein LOC108559595 [Nicrophorus vespilloides]
MWSAVAPCEEDTPAPSARSKHSATLVGDHVYLLGGRNGNLPMKDFWKYNLVTGKWQQLKPSGEKLPCLQEHSTVAYKESIYVFGGEVSFSAGTETPLWVYDIKNNSWKKVRARKGVATPKGRRGHSALVHKGSMLIYGGYQDLRGSCSELWAFHFETESWHLVSSGPTKGTSDTNPPARHKHSAVIHDDAMWIYGGMTDLQERSDLWKWDTVSGTWSTIKTKINPGPLHSHAACRLPSSMILFGGERDGHSTNDLWKFNFGNEMWEKVNILGIKPQPRAETIAFAVSELLLKDPSGVNTLDSRSNRTKVRTCNSADRGGRHSSYFPNNRITPCEQTFVFEPSNANYTDGSELENGNKSNKGSFLQEISKLSQLNISRKCNYSVLTGCATESTESLIRNQKTSPKEIEETELSTPTRGTMVKSKSAYVIKKKYSDAEGAPQKRRVEFDATAIKIPREPISVPNFSLLTLPTPVLTPVEATRLVFLDNDEDNLDNYHYDNEFVTSNYDIETITHVQPSPSPTKEETIMDSFKPLKRGESYSSHLAYADNPLYQHMINSTSGKFSNYEENVSSTSDYCSIETVNRLSSASNYSVKTPQEEPKRKEASFGFCNPNYQGPADKKAQEDAKNANNDQLELQNFNGVITKNTRVFFRNTNRSTRPPKQLSLAKKESKSRAVSAGRVERKKIQQEAKTIEPFVPLYVFIIGGKEHGQVTLFQRPLSIWKLKLF